MRWIHTIQTDNQMTPRKGLILERDGLKLSRVHLILGAKTPWRSWQMIDYQNGITYAKAEYWARITWNSKEARPTAGGTWNVAWGGTVDTAAKLVATTKHVLIYREETP